jgi:hypothetical protein
MKPAPAPHVPGDTEAVRMSNAVRQIMSVSKGAIFKAEGKRKREQPKKKAPQEILDLQIAVLSNHASLPGYQILSGVLSPKSEEGIRTGWMFRGPEAEVYG